MSALPTKVYGPLDRSLIWTLLIQEYPGFKDMETQEASGLTSECCAAWAKSPETDMAVFVKSWIAHETDWQTVRIRAEQSAEQRFVEAESLGLDPNGLDADQVEALIKDFLPEGCTVEQYLDPHIEGAASRVAFDIQRWNGTGWGDYDPVFDQEEAFAFLRRHRLAGSKRFRVVQRTPVVVVDRG